MGDQFRLGAKQLPNSVFGPLVLLQRIETGQARAQPRRSAPQDFCAKIVSRRREDEGSVLLLQRLSSLVGVYCGQYDVGPLPGRKEIFKAAIVRYNLESHLC